ncbi:18644_t:CDS:1, partial [Acaulospora morrowiae]
KSSSSVSSANKYKILQRISDGIEYLQRNIENKSLSVFSPEIESRLNDQDREYQILQKINDEIRHLQRIIISQKSSEFQELLNYWNNEHKTLQTIGDRIKTLQRTIEDKLTDFPENSRIQKQLYDKIESLSNYKNRDYEILQKIDEIKGINQLRYLKSIEGILHENFDMLKRILTPQMSKFEESEKWKERYNQAISLLGSELKFT